MLQKKIINLDMDGTFVDLYGVEDWLPQLRAEETTPYAIAKPLMNLSQLARLLNKARRNGFIINIISWTSKGGSDEYNQAVADTKRKWLNKHLPSVKFDNIHIVPYGVDKHSLAEGIIFDDDDKVRKAWGIENAYEPNLLIGFLQRI